MRYPMPNPDLEIRGTGAVIQTLRLGGARSPKNFFGPLGDTFGLKIRGRGPGRPGPSPGSATDTTAIVTLYRIHLFNSYSLVIDF